MVKSDIIRNPTREEMADFNPIATPAGKIHTPQSEFVSKIAKMKLEAQERGIKERGMAYPFADHAAMMEFENYYKGLTRSVMKKHGYVTPALLSAENTNKPDLNEFGNLDNFTIIDEGEQYDENLSKKNPGVSVMVKKIKYKYKDFYHTYTCMETAEDAIKRAREANMLQEHEVKKKLNKK